LLLIKNGNLITMAGMYEQTGDILIDDGKIVKVGQVGEVPEDCQIIDAAGRTVTPGLVDPPLPCRSMGNRLPRGNGRK